MQKVVTIFFIVILNTSCAQLRLKNSTGDCTEQYLNYLNKHIKYNNTDNYFEISKAFNDSIGNQRLHCESKIDTNEVIKILGKGINLKIDIVTLPFKMYGHKITKQYIYPTSKSIEQQKKINSSLKSYSVNYLIVQFNEKGKLVRFAPYGYIESVND